MNFEMRKNETLLMNGPALLKWNSAHFKAIAHVSPNLLFSRGVKPTTHFHLVPRSRMVELYLHTPYVFMAW
jgi:hypothetical protein